MSERRDTVEWRRLLEEALTAPGDLTGIYNRFHDYSLANMLFFRLQGLHEPVASFSRWKALGRSVLRGARAKAVIVPVLAQGASAASEPISSEPSEEASAPERKAIAARLVGFKVVRAVFALSDTRGLDLPPVETPSWDLATALGTLGVREVPFDELNGNIQGYSRGVEFAINPLAVNRTKTVFHELGHIVLGHTLPAMQAEYRVHRGITEFEAEGTALLAMNEVGLLDEPTASASRAYIQHWLNHEQPSERSLRRIFGAAEAILKAGRLAAGPVGGAGDTGPGGAGP